MIDTTATRPNVTRDRSRQHCGDQWKWQCPACNNGAVHLDRDAAYSAGAYHWASCAALQRNRLLQQIATITPALRNVRTEAAAQNLPAQMFHGYDLATSVVRLRMHELDNDMQRWRQNWERP